MKTTEILNKILSDIKLENSKKWRVESNAPMSNDESNQFLLSILKNNYAIDDEDFLIGMFGQNGYEAIREAERTIVE